MAVDPRFSGLAKAWDGSRKIRRRLSNGQDFVRWPVNEAGTHPTSTAALALNSESLCIMVKKIRINAKKIAIKKLEGAAH